VSSSRADLESPARPPDPHAGPWVRRGTTILCIALAVLFAYAGIGKLASGEAVVERFIVWGYSDAFRLFIGICELCGAVGLLVPRLALSACAGLAGILVGAVYTHWSHGESGGVALITLGLVVLSAILRRDDAFFTWVRRPQPGPSSSARSS